MKDATLKSGANPRYVDNNEATADSAIPGLARDAEGLKTFGRVALGIGALADGIGSGVSYYQSHQDQGVGKAILVGTTHAVLSTAASYIFASAAAGFAEATITGLAEGTIIGAATALIPVPGVGTAVGVLVATSVAGAVGGLVGSAVGDLIANSWF